MKNFLTNLISRTISYFRPKPNLNTILRGFIVVSDELTSLIDDHNAVIVRNNERIKQIAHESTLLVDEVEKAEKVRGNIIQILGEQS